MVNAQPIVITIFLSLPEERGRVEEVGPMSLYMEFFLCGWHPLGALG